MSGMPKMELPNMGLQLCSTAPNHPLLVSKVDEDGMLSESVTFGCVWSACFVCAFDPHTACTCMFCVCLRWCDFVLLPLLILAGEYTCTCVCVAYSCACRWCVRVHTCNTHTRILCSLPLYIFIYVLKSRSRVWNLVSGWYSRQRGWQAVSESNRSC